MPEPSMDVRAALQREASRRLAKLRGARAKEILRELVDDLEDRAQALIDEGVTAEAALAQVIGESCDWRRLAENLEAEIMEEKMHKLRCLWALGVQPRVHVQYIDYMQTNFAMSLIYVLAGATAALMSLYFDGSRRRRMMAALAYPAAMACVLALALVVSAGGAIAEHQWGQWLQHLNMTALMFFFVVVMPAIQMGCAALPFVVYKRAPRCEPPTAAA